MGESVLDKLGIPVPLSTPEADPTKLVIHDSEWGWREGNTPAPPLESREPRQTVYDKGPGDGLANPPADTTILNRHDFGTAPQTHSDPTTGGTSPSITYTPITYTLPDGTEGVALVAPNRPAVISTESGDQYTVGLDGQVTWIDPTPPGDGTLQPVAPHDPADTAALGTDQVGATNPGATSSSTPLDAIVPYAQGVNSALSLIQAIEHGNTLSAVLAGGSLAATLHSLTDGTVPALPGEIAGTLSDLSAGLSLLNALDHGDPLGALAAGSNLASQAAALWSNVAANAAFDALEAGGMDLAAETAAHEMGAVAGSLGEVAGVIGAINSLAHGDPVGAIAAILMMDPVTAPIGIAISIVSAVFGGLFGGDDEPAYVWVRPTGDAHFVRTDTGIDIEATGTNTHKNIEGTAVGAATQGGQAVAGALQSLLGDLQSQIDQHNAAHPDALLALVPERLPQLYYNDPAYYAQWVDAASGEPRSIAVSGRDLAADLLAVAQSGQAIVPQWQADTIAQRIEQGQTDAWRPDPHHPASGDTQTEAVLVAGSGQMDGIVRSDLDGDGWQEAHTWSIDNLYLALDTRGDGTLQGMDDLVTRSGDARAANSLGWLDANHDGVLDRNDPGFAALKVWLDANGDAVAQAGETATLTEAGIVAIDFRSDPPQLIDAQGHGTALTQAQLAGETQGILAQHTDGGTLLAHEDGDIRYMPDADYYGAAGFSKIFAAHPAKRRAKPATRRRVNPCSCKRHAKCLDRDKDMQISYWHAQAPFERLFTQRRHPRFQQSSRCRRRSLAFGGYAVVPYAVLQEGAHKCS